MPSHIHNVPPTASALATTATLFTTINNNNVCDFQSESPAPTDDVFLLCIGTGVYNARKVFRVVPVFLFLQHAILHGVCTVQMI